MIALVIKKTPDGSKKKYTAVFTLDNGRTKTVNFGSKGSNSFIDKATVKTKNAYLARHRVNEDWYDYMSAGALSKWILWGDSNRITKNIATFKKKFKLK